MEQNEKRVILIDEDILTEDLRELREILDASVQTIRMSRYGVEANEIKRAVKDIEEVSHVLDCLSKKKFAYSQSETILLGK